MCKIKTKAYIVLLNKEERDSQEGREGIRELVVFIRGMQMACCHMGLHTHTVETERESSIEPKVLCGWGTWGRCGAVSLNSNHTYQEVEQKPKARAHSKRPFVLKEPESEGMLWHLKICNLDQSDNVVYQPQKTSARTGRRDGLEDHECPSHTAASLMICGGGSAT